MLAVKVPGTWSFDHRGRVLATKRATMLDNPVVGRPATASAGTLGLGSEHEEPR